LTTTGTTRSYRRRIDNVVLRWQARLDSDWSDRTLPWLLATGLFVILLLLSLARLRSLEGTADLAAYTQAVWLINAKLDPIVTIGQDTNVLATHAAFVLYPVSLLGHVMPTAYALVTLQAGALALTLVPIWRVARRLADLRVGGAFTLVLVYALYPTLHTVNLAGFFPEVLALPAIVYAAYYGLSKHWRRFVACCIFIVICRADFGLIVAGLGALVWASGRKTEGRLVCFGGLLYAVVAVLVIEPHLGSGTSHVESFEAFGTTPLGVVGGLFAHPGDVFHAITREQNFDLFVTLFAPVAFIPLLAPRYLLPVLPLELFYLVSSVPPEVVYGQQTIAITAFVFIASAFALAKVGRRGIERITVDRRVLAVMVLAATVFFVRDSVTSPYRSPWAWGGQDIVDRARLDTEQQVGDRSVRASPSVLVDLAERQHVYELAPDAAPDPEAIGAGVDAVIIDDRSVSGWSASDHQAVRRGLEGSGFDRVSDEQGIELFLRR
jgi:uncharacterized membrane protein